LSSFFGALFEPLARTTGRFIKEHPDNAVSQILQEPMVQASIVTAVRGVQRRRQEVEEEEAAEAATKAARAQDVSDDGGSDTGSTPG